MREIMDVQGLDHNYAHPKGHPRGWKEDKLET